VEAVKTDRIGADHTRIELRIANLGYLGTFGLSSAKKLAISEPLRATVECEGVTLEAPSESVVEIGHLAGWGQGLYNGATAFFPWTRGNVHERFVTLVVRGKGRLRVKVGSVRVGQRTLELRVS
jgi:hypothetical protein